MKKFLPLSIILLFACALVHGQIMQKGVVNTAIPIRVSYNFSTIENPLSNGGNFTALSDANFTGALKVIAGNLCEPTTTAAASAVFWSGTTWPVNQYTEVTLTTWATAGDFVYFILRQGAFNSGTQYLANVSQAGTYQFYGIVGGTLHSLQTGSQASAQGDVFRFSVVGNVLTLYRNGSSVQTFTDTNNYVTAGSPGFGLLSPAAGIARAQTSLWSAGTN